MRLQATRPVRADIRIKFPKQDECDRLQRELEQNRLADPQYDQKVKDQQMRRNIHAYLKHQKTKYIEDDQQWQNFRQEISQI